MFALDIPEIRDHLAQYLDTRTFFTSTLVCRSWQESFTPFLYKTCSVIATSKRNPARETIDKYAHFVQALRVSGCIASLEYYEVRCRNLHTLTVDGNWGMGGGRKLLPVTLGSFSSGLNPTSNNNGSSSTSIDIEKREALVALEFSSTVADLILRNPNLVHVLFLDQPCISSNKLWNALANSPKISSIQLTNCTILPADTPAFWEACSKTETLHLLRLKLPDGEAFYPPMKVPLSDRELLLPTTTDTTTTTTTSATVTTAATTTSVPLSLSSPPSPPSKYSTLSMSSLSLSDTTSSSPFSSTSPASSVSLTNSNNSNKKDEKALFSRLQTLQMSGINEGFRIIAQAPLLRSWQWSLGDKPFPYQAIEHTLPRLKPFRFFRDLGINMRELSDTSIEELLDRMTDARDLNLNWTDFGTKSFQVLMIRHSTTLRSLHLMCYQILSKHIQTLLTTCSGLESFGANVLLGTELVLFGAPTKDGSETDEVDFTSPDYNYDMDVLMQHRSLGSGQGTLLGDEWVCLGLKSLALNFSLGGHYLLFNGKNPEDLVRIEKQRDLEQEHTFRQLSRLTQLEKLHMVNATGELPFQHGVNLKLKAKGGRLEDLVTLTKLDTINFAGTKQSLEEEDVTWMWEHWPRLMFIMGVFNQDPVVNTRVVAAYQARQRTKWYK